MRVDPSLYQLQNAKRLLDGAFIILWERLPTEKGMTLRERIVGSLKRAGHKILPEAIVFAMQRYRSLARNERSLYLKMRISDQLGLTNRKRSRAPTTARSILFVCFGNIMRSPMCEALLSQEFASRNAVHDSVTSAGLNATPGRTVHEWAVTAAREFGISLENHRARLLTSDMIERADAIFVMDYHNRAQMLSRWPESKSKVFMLSAYADTEYRSVEISDPYYSGLEGTQQCYRILKACVRNLAEGLFNSGPVGQKSEP